MVSELKAQIRFKEPRVVGINTCQNDRRLWSE